MSKPQMIHIPQDDRTRVATVHIYEAERKRGMKASETVAYALSDAANVFDLISSGLIGGSLDRNGAGVISLTRICSEYFRAMADNEGEELHRLARTLERPAHVEGQEEEPR
jgi:hypothetical protein